MVSVCVTFSPVRRSATMESGDAPTAGGPSVVAVARFEIGEAFPSSSNALTAKKYPVENPRPLTRKLSAAPEGCGSGGFGATEAAEKLPSVIGEVEYLMS